MHSEYIFYLKHAQLLNNKYSSSGVNVQYFQLVLNYKYRNEVANCLVTHWKSVQTYIFMYNYTF